ncbi:MAG: NAD-dependent epimerase/dehydratase family protein, partial [Actinobacteria bacterium]|nr:NAD-dependent epimerase/dehydratase family protein [Actinomycetota bacterium]
LGRALVEDALARGHEVTLFNRGQTNPELFPEAEKIHGDRDGDLSALEGRSWDAVVDTCGYFPRIVLASAEALANSVGQYTFISTISVYADLSKPVDESSPLGTIEDETVEEFGPEFENYGALKALSERAVQDVFGDRALIVRPGFIVGPHDPTDRFTYWPVRAARRGPMLAPGPPERPIQFIDVRDLAAWILRMVEEGRSGAFNATNEGVPLGDLLADADVVWASDDWLVEQGVTEEELPLWSADAGYKAIHEANVSAALAAGLTFRPAAETARDALDWRGADAELATGMSSEREAELLAARQS